MMSPAYHLAAMPSLICRVANAAKASSGNWRRPPTRGGSCCRAAVLRDTKRSSTPGTLSRNNEQQLGFLSSGHANATQYDRWLIIRAGDVELNPGPLCILHGTARAFVRRMKELTKFAVKAEIDVIAVQEANLLNQGTVRINRFADPIIGRRKVDRTTNGPIKVGDVAIFIRNGINHQVILTPPTSIPLTPSRNGLGPQYLRTTTQVAYISTTYMSHPSALTETTNASITSTSTCYARDLTISSSVM